MTPYEEQEFESPSDISTCWCGEINPWFSAYYRRGCGGTETTECICGGEFCVCHWHGEVPCMGCPDCEGPPEYEEEL